MALQFPEGLLLYACVIADILEGWVRQGGRMPAWKAAERQRPRLQVAGYVSCKSSCCCTAGCSSWYACGTFRSAGVVQAVVMGEEVELCRTHPDANLPAGLRGWSRPSSWATSLLAPAASTTTRQRRWGRTFWCTTATAGAFSCVCFCSCSPKVACCLCGISRPFLSAASVWRSGTCSTVCHLRLSAALCLSTPLSQPCSSGRHQSALHVRVCGHQNGHRALHCLDTVGAGLCGG